MLAQLDDNNREIEQQRYEIKRLREQVQLLLQRAPVDDPEFFLFEQQQQLISPSSTPGVLAGHRGDTPGDELRRGMSAPPPNTSIQGSESARQKRGGSAGRSRNNSSEAIAQPMARPSTAPLIVEDDTFENSDHEVE